MYEIAKEHEEKLANLKLPSGYELDRENLVKQYQQDIASIYHSFWQELIKKYNINNNQHSNQIYDLAYEHGYSEGLDKIEEWFATLTSILD